MEEYLTISAVAASRQAAQEEREDQDQEEEVSVSPPLTGQHWNHEVHARGAAFGFNAIPFISQAERLGEFPISNKDNVNNSRQEYLEELEKWSSPPSYSEVVTKDSTSNDGEEPDKREDNVSEGDSHQVTIDMEMLTSEAGLPSYDDACRINNINNNYI